MSKAIVITAGHSNVDPGAVNGTDHEAVFVTKVRNAVAYVLREKGLTVVTDGVGDINEPLAAAIKLIKGSAVAVEFHLNAAAAKTATGVETISLPKHKQLAQDLSKAVSDVFNFRLRGDGKGWIDQSQSNRGKLGYVTAGGLIVELGFISNNADLQVMKDNYWKAARAMADVIAKHVGG